MSSPCKQSYHLSDLSVNLQSDLNKYQNSDMDTLAKRLIAARTDAKLSQEKLAKLAGVNQSTVGMLESGERKKSAYIPLFAHILKVSALWLSDGIGEKYDINNMPKGVKVYFVSDDDKDVQNTFDTILAMKKGAVKELKSDGLDTNDEQPESRNGTEHNNGTE